MTTDNKEIQEDQNFEYVGFWARTGASIIDSILMFIIVIVLVLGLNLIQPGSIAAAQQGPDTFDLLFNIFIVAAIIALWVKYGATPGKKMVRAKIVKKDGSPLTIGTAIIRYFSYFISMATLGLGFLIVAFDSKKRGFHDMIAGTIVIKD